MTPIGAMPSPALGHHQGRTESSILLVSPNRHQTDLLPPQLDLELIAGLEVQQRGIGFAHHQASLPLDRGQIEAGKQDKLSS